MPTLLWLGSHPGARWSFSKKRRCWFHLRCCPESNAQWHKQVSEVHASLNGSSEMKSLQIKRVVTYWAFLSSYQDHFRTEFRIEANFSQKLQPSVDTQHNTTERTNRKWSSTLFHLCGIDKPQELTLELEAWCLCPLGVPPFPLLLINKHFRGKDTSVFLNSHVSWESSHHLFYCVHSYFLQSRPSYSSLHKPYK